MGRFSGPPWHPKSQAHTWTPGVGAPLSLSYRFLGKNLALKSHPPPGRLFEEVWFLTGHCACGSEGGAGRRGLCGAGAGEGTWTGDRAPEGWAAGRISGQWTGGYGTRLGLAGWAGGGSGGLARWGSGGGPGTVTPWPSPPGPLTPGSPRGPRRSGKWRPGRGRR